MKSVLVLYYLLDAAPIINILTPLRYLEEQGEITLDHSRENTVTPQQIQAADLIVSCRSLSPRHKPIYDYAHLLGIPIIFDLDDNLFAIPKDSGVYYYFGLPDNQKQLKWMIENADLVRVYSPVLADVIRSMNEHIEIVWAAIDWTLVPETLPPLRKPLEIVYAVGATSGEMFYPIIRDDIKRLLQDYGDSIRFHMLGYKEQHLLHLANVIYTPFENDYAKFFEDFTNYGYAIGLAPMKDDVFFECKTDLKFRDYAAAGVVGIFTDSPLYNKVQHGVTGIIVQNESGNWYKAIADLLDNPQKLDAIREEARRFAFQQYHVSKTSTQWLREIQSLDRKPPSPNLTHPESWWFTKAEKQSPSKASILSSIRPIIRKIYLSAVPFKVHIILMSIYNRIVRLRAHLSRT